MSDTWADRLSEYLDGELPSPEAAELERHLRECDACRRTLAELRIVVARLAADTIGTADQPTGREWNALEAGVRIPMRGRIVPAALAASLVGLTVLGSLLLPGESGEPAVPAPESHSAVFQQPLLDLETVLRENQTRLRPETVKALEASMAAIDSAIRQAERALATDPANEYITRAVGRLRTARFTMLRHAVAAAQPIG